jgi:hypothetical protein
MSIKRGWAVGDEKGPDAFFEGANFVEALAEAEKLYPRHTRIEFEGDLDTLESDLRLKSGLERQVHPPKLARKFIIETFYDTDTGDLMVAATPLDLGVASAAVAYTEPNEVAIGP